MVSDGASRYSDEVVVTWKCLQPSKNRAIPVYQPPRLLCCFLNFILGFRSEVASIVAFAQLLARFPTHPIDHATPLYRISTMELIGPALNVRIGLDWTSRNSSASYWLKIASPPYHGKIAMSAMVYSSPTM